MQQMDDFKKEYTNIFMIANIKGSIKFLYSIKRIFHFDYAIDLCPYSLMNLKTLSVLDNFFIYSSLVRIKAYLRLPKTFAIIRFLCKMLHERTYRIERIIRLIYEKLLKCIWNKVVIKSSKWQLKHQNWTTTLLMLLCYHSFA